MQRLIAASIILISSCVMLCAQTPAPAPKKTDEPANGIIAGTVVDESGQPMAGASLFVRPVNSGVGTRTATSDPDGSFRITGLEPALYIVSGNAPAYTTIPSETGAPTYYRIGDTVRVELVRGGAITGTVTNSLGESVIAVRVRATLVRDHRGEIARSPVNNEQTTDDRGVYRIYGLRPGTYIVSAGGAGFSNAFNPYDMDAPTYAPSSTRDNAAEVVVRSGEDSNIDIRYRGEPGHVISGTIKFSGPNGASVSLLQAGSPAMLATTFQTPASRGFAFNGIGDGEYDLLAQEMMTSPATTSTMPVLSVADPKRVTVKGADVTGIELVTKPLSSISGKISMEASKEPECKGKRAPLLAETMIRIQVPEKEPGKEDLRPRFFSPSASPDASGAFVVRNLAPGQYRFEPLFYGRYWYVQSITMNTGTAKSRKIDAAANWTMLKSGDQLNLNITIAQGGASIRGRVAAPESATAPPPTTVYLVPSEPDKAEDVLRYFESEVGTDLTFAFYSVPPGRYFALVDTQTTPLTKLRQPESAPTRMKLRRSAEAKKNTIELKPCQNLTDYQAKQ